MSRALLVAVLAALALAAPAAALLPVEPSGSAVGDGRPLKAYASLSPVVHLFGDAVTAQVAVVADTKWIDPARVRVTATFTPYKAVQHSVLRSGSGRFLQITWTWKLRCLASKCVPRTPPSDTLHVFQFRPAKIDYLAPDGTKQYGITAGFPPVETLSQISPGTVTFLQRHNALKWQVRLAPVAAPRYGLTPGFVFWLALSLAAVFGTAGIAVAGRWAWLTRPRRTAAATGPATTLDRALALFFWARERGDDTLQRKALERVAEELETGPDADLSDAARALAWSQETPEDSDVKAISDRAHGSPPPPGGTP